MQEKIKKWNFDFRIGKPLKEAGSASPSSSHVYEAIDEQEVNWIHSLENWIDNIDWAEAVLEFLSFLIKFGGFISWKLCLAINVQAYFITLWMNFVYGQW